VIVLLYQSNNIHTSLRCNTYLIKTPLEGMRIRGQRFRDKLQHTMASVDLEWRRRISTCTPDMPMATAIFAVQDDCRLATSGFDDWRKPGFHHEDRC
jgi:hypothetical protein